MGNSHHNSRNRHNKHSSSVIQYNNYEKQKQVPIVTKYGEKHQDIFSVNDNKISKCTYMVDDEDNFKLKIHLWENGALHLSHAIGTKLSQFHHTVGDRVGQYQIVQYCIDYENNNILTINNLNRLMRIFAFDDPHFTASSEIDITCPPNVNSMAIYDSQLYMLSESNLIVKKLYGNTENIKKDVKCITSCYGYFAYVTNDDKVMIEQNEQIIELQIKNIKGIKQIICSNYHIVVRDNNNQVHIHGPKTDNLDEIIDQYKNFITTKINVEYQVIDMFMTNKYLYVLSSNNDVYEMDYRSICPEKNKSYCLVANKINVINQSRIIKEWSPNNHIEFPKKFRKNIETFLFCLKRIQYKSGVKIPKFVIFEIIKFSI